MDNAILYQSSLLEPLKKALPITGDLFSNLGLGFDVVQGVAHHRVLKWRSEWRDNVNIY